MQATGYEVIAHILLLFTLQRCEFFSKSQRNANDAIKSKLLFTLQRCEFFSKSQPSDGE